MQGRKLRNEISSKQIKNQKNAALDLHYFADMCLGFLYETFGTKGKRGQ